MVQFKVGSVYEVRSACDSNCVWSYKIISRTAKTIKTECGLTLRIKPDFTNKNSDKCEGVYPQGKFSMAPILKAV